MYCKKQARKEIKIKSHSAPKYSSSSSQFSAALVHHKHLASILSVCYLITSGIPPTVFLWCSIVICSYILCNMMGCLGGRNFEGFSI
ncbi:hypothetical protein GLYMA_01G135700v4 [Glycine max]|uniref:Uncharacterized protein n=2 Tax=Glycine subgen. Soja TaxID=1462606 RepID=A0A0R0LAF6_SOYBN|nr:hypothetical protein JHK87_001670 [Glycine soja]KAG5069342.1 hypothetical protein JHK85_001719 [Glycine max]KAG5089067.1 hypothetical protein JHK86_001679 [Glycine max]KAH1162960.1 hypothetical protein GYH30_001472 [Glycine max]KRH76161.1 hypothetical protein GLYMA_01G135700v4 [Glycine max]